MMVNLQDVLKIIDEASVGIGSVDATEMYSQLVSKLEEMVLTERIDQEIAIDKLLGSGVVEEATREEASAGTDCGRPVVPSITLSTAKGLANEYSSWKVRAIDYLKSNAWEWEERCGYKKEGFVTDSIIMAMVWQECFFEQ